MSKYKSQLYKDIIEYCHAYYQTHEKCEKCTHDTGVCSGSCDNCLSQIHRNNEPRSNYDCNRLTSYYVCRFLNKYASEILYALQSDFLRDSLLQKKKFNVLSLGCGSSSDYFAFDIFRNTNMPDTVINYHGLDLSNGWAHINDKINEFKKNTDEVKIFYNDVFGRIMEKPVRNANILVIQNLFSTLNKKNDATFINMFDNFVDSLARNIIECRAKNLIIIINDINHYLCARDKWKESFISTLSQKYSGNIEFQTRYFSGYSEPLWIQYESNKFLIEPAYEEYIYQGNLTDCSEIQLLIKIGDNI